VVIGRTRSGRLGVVGFVLACLPLALIWVPSGGREVMVSSDANGALVQEEHRVSLIANEGWTVVIPFLVAAVIALVPLLVARRRFARGARIVAASLFAVGVVISLASIGIFFLPALGALAAAAAVDDGSDAAELGGSSAIPPSAPAD
jgi:hypothetical protein